ncbi:hypothetical protein GCM10010428_09910 [Actinosynnema pretiosum subsp. pretiosum]
MVRPFHPPPTPYGAGHRGVDLAAPPGAKVMASAKGTVLHAAPIAGRPVISVHHEDGTRTTYEPVHPAVRKGDRVTAGTHLGTLLPAHPGCPTEACLHWAAIRRPTHSSPRAYANPLSLLRPPRPRLLPSPPPHQDHVSFSRAPSFLPHAHPPTAFSTRTRCDQPTPPTELTTDSRNKEATYSKTPHTTTPTDISHSHQKPSHQFPVTGHREAPKIRTSRHQLRIP